MPRFTISRETPFLVNSRNFEIGFSSTGYTLEFSVDGENYTAWPEETPANETCMVNGVTSGGYFRLKGNGDDKVVILYESN